MKKKITACPICDSAATRLEPDNTIYNCRYCDHTFWLRPNIYNTKESITTLKEDMFPEDIESDRYEGYEIQLHSVLGEIDRHVHRTAGKRKKYA